MTVLTSISQYQQRLNTISSAILGFFSQHGGQARTQVTERNVQRALSAVESLLAKYPYSSVKRGSDWITVLPACDDGFSVSLMADAGRLTVALADWYDDFESLPAALHLMELALKGDIRVRVDSIGGSPIRWTVEQCNFAGEWSELGAMFANRGCPTMENHHFLQNSPAA